MQVSATVPLKVTSAAASGAEPVSANTNASSRTIPSDMLNMRIRIGPVWLTPLGRPPTINPYGPQRPSFIRRAA